MGRRLGRRALGSPDRDALAPAVAVARSTAAESFDELMPWDLELR